MSTELSASDVAILAYLRQAPTGLDELETVLALPRGARTSIERLEARGFVQVVDDALYCLGPGAAYLDKRSVVVWTEPTDASTCLGKSGKLDGSDLVLSTHGNDEGERID